MTEPPDGGLVAELKIFARIDAGKGLVRNGKVKRSAEWLPAVGRMTLHQPVRRDVGTRFGVVPFERRDARLLVVQFKGESLPKDRR